MQEVPEVIEPVFISPAFERQFKNEFLKALDKQLLQISMELERIPSVAIDARCCENNFVFCKFFTPQKTIPLEIKKECILTSIQNVENSIIKVRKNYNIINSVETYLYLKQLKEVISIYTTEKNNSTNVDSKLKKVKNFGENILPKFIEKTIVFCNAILRTHENQKESGQILLRQENIRLKQENVKLQQDNAKLKEKIDKLRHVIKNQSEKIISKKQRIRYLIKSLKQKDTKSTKKQTLLNATINNLKEDINELKVKNQEWVVLTKSLKMSYKSSMEKFNEKLRCQNEPHPAPEKLFPNLFITNRQINTKCCSHPAISVFPKLHRRNNNTNMNKNHEQVKNIQFLLK